MDDFLDVIFAEAEPDEAIAFFAFPHHPTSSDKWPTKTEKAVLRASKSQRKHEIYFSVSTYTPQEDGYVRRTRAAFSGIHAIPLDDIGTKAQAPDITPTTVVETSPGNYQWLLALAEPLRDYELASAFIKKLADLGYTDAGGSMPNKVMRLPLGWNLKKHLDEPWKVRLTELNWGAVHTLEEWAQMLGIDLNNLDVDAPRVAPDKMPEQVDSIDEVYKWLSTRLPGQPGAVVGAPNQDGFVDIICPWHEEHTEGDKQGTGYKLLGRGNVPTSRAFHCFHSHNKSTKDFLEWVAANGGPECSSNDPAPYYRKKYALVEHGKQVVDLEDDNPATAIRSLDEFKAAHSQSYKLPGMKTGVAAHKIWLSDHRLTKLRNIRFDPRHEQRLTLESGQRYYNTFRPPQHPQVSGDPSIFLDHIEYLLPVKVEREHYLNWLACKVQQPWSRSHSVFLIAPETYGTGRSWLADIARQVFSGLAGNVSFPQLMGYGSQGAFNDWLSRKLLLSVDEVKDLSGSQKTRDIYDAYEHFKTFIDSKPVWVKINVKFGKGGDEEVWANFQAFSNHPDAMVIPELDRRIWAAYNPTWVHAPKYYDKLYKALLDGREASRVWWWLQDRDISTFSATAPPPMTAAKKDMIASSRSTIDLVLDHVIEGLKGCLVTAYQIECLVARSPAIMDQNTNRGAIRKQAQRRWAMLPAVRFADGSVPEVRLPAEYRQVNGLRDVPVPVRYVGDGDLSAVALRMRNQHGWAGKELLKNGDPQMVQAA